MVFTDGRWELILWKMNKTGWLDRGFFLGATVLGALGFGGAAHAGLIIENNLAYMSSALTTGSSDSSTKYLGSLAFGATVPSSFQVGWNINLVSHADSTSLGSTSLSGTEMGPRFGWFIGKNQWFSLAASYHPLVSATYTPAGGSAEKWSGSGYELEAGFAPQVGKHLYAGIKILYDHAGYSSRTDSANATSDISYSYNSILPALYLSWRF
jgi:hypothetical protein